MTLETVAYIKEHGLNKLLEDFKLKTSETDNKVLIKYDQIESNYAYEIVRECRGLILEKDTWKIMSFPFKKFFNIQEGHAPKIDWSTAHVLEKVDGTFIHLYWDWNKEEWCVGTTGTPEGDGPVNMRTNFTFKQLFWETVGNKYPEFITNKLGKHLVYMFELTSPYNTVVKQHTEPALTLLGVRNRDTLEEFPFRWVIKESIIIGIPVVKLFPLLQPRGVAELTKTFDGMPYSEEGYVVLDVYMNRVKVKNPAYVAVHHLKDRMNSYNIMEIIKTNEVDEFNATFPERTEEVMFLKRCYDDLTQRLIKMWDIIKTEVPSDYEDKGQVKTYAALVSDVRDFNPWSKGFYHVFYGLGNGRVESIQQYLKDYDNRKLYLEFTEKEIWNINR